MPVKVTVHNYFGSTSTRDADVKIVYNKLLGGWYVVRGPSQTPLSGRFNTEEEAKMWLLLRKNARDVAANGKTVAGDAARTVISAFYKGDVNSDTDRAVRAAFGAWFDGAGGWLGSNERDASGTVPNNNVAGVLSRLKQIPGVVVTTRARDGVRDGAVEEYLAWVDARLKELPNASARRRFVEEQERGFAQRYADFQRRAASNGRIYPGETAWAYSATLRGLAQRLNQTGDAGSSNRDPDQSDLNAAARGLNMLSKSPAELRQLIDAHSGNSLFASRVITAAAKQMLAAKLRMGARDVGDAPRIEQGLSDDEPRIVSGVRGMKSTPFSKRFKNSAEMERWMDSDDYDNVTVYQIERSQR